MVIRIAFLIFDTLNIAILIVIGETDDSSIDGERELVDCMLRYIFSTSPSPLFRWSCDPRFKVLVCVNITYVMRLNHHHALQLSNLCSRRSSFKCELLTTAARIKGFAAFC